MPSKTSTSGTTDNTKSNIAGSNGDRGDSDHKIAEVPGAAGKSKAGNTQQIFKLLMGAGGIFSAFSYYGVLHENIFKGTGFSQSWYLQAIEASANVLIGGLMLQLTGSKSVLPQELMMYSGISQVSAKSFTSSALASNVSFPIVTLAKSGKMIPIMIGSILIGGKQYTAKDYLSVLAIIVGTCLVSIGGSKKSHGSGGVDETSWKGILFIVLSLACDGFTGGVQDKIKEKAEKEKKGNPGSWDLMFYTNLYMALVAILISLFKGEISEGNEQFFSNHKLFFDVLKYAFCSAIGQSFIFYTISNFGPLTCSTVTTTRKVFSVLLSIFLHGYELSRNQKVGLMIACSGIFMELIKGKDKKHDQAPTSDSDKTSKKAP